MLSSLFFKEKPVRTLAALSDKDKKWYASMLCKKIDCTYPHMINTLNTFGRLGLISTEGAGRIKLIRLTPQGEDLAHEFEGLLRRLDRIEMPEKEVIEVDEFTQTKKERKLGKKQKEKPEEKAGPEVA